MILTIPFIKNEIEIKTIMYDPPSSGINSTNIENITVSIPIIINNILNQLSNFLDPIPRIILIAPIMSRAIAIKRYHRSRACVGSDTIINITTIDRINAKAPEINLDIAFKLDNFSSEDALTIRPIPVINRTIERINATERLVTSGYIIVIIEKKIINTPIKILDV